MYRERMFGRSASQESTYAPIEASERVMTRDEAVSFLAEHGIEPIHDWKFETPLLYVLDETYKGATSDYARLPLDRRPTIARLSAPTSLEYTPREGYDPVYRISNETGAKIDYYAVNAETKEIVHVKTSRNERTQDCPYIARVGNVFMANDELFPPSPEPES